MGLQVFHPGASDRPERDDVDVTATVVQTPAAADPGTRVEHPLLGLGPAQPVVVAPLERAEQLPSAVGEPLADRGPAAYQLNAAILQRAVQALQQAHRDAEAVQGGGGQAGGAFVSRVAALPPAGG